jgi:glycosyltransferase involved in cell wall biosynthesis
VKKNTTVLLIAFKYPPYAGVGGFRWTKLTKYLAQQGYTIHVVTINWKETGADTYREDITHPNIIIHRIPSCYLHNIKYKRYKNTPLGQIRRFVKYGCFKFIDLFWYDDEAHYWGLSLLPFCKKLIQEEHIKTVIATGHPFMANYWASKLKQDLSEIHLIQDFQDPWTDNVRKLYPIPFMRTRSLQHERFALNHCDVFFTVSPSLMNILEKKIHASVKTAVIHNGFDIPLATKPSLKRSFSFLYAGGVYFGREEPLEAFLTAVDAIKNSTPEITISFYGEFPHHLKKKFRHLFTAGILAHFPFISPQEIQQKMYESFICLLFNSRILPYALSTKIYEYASVRRPTLAVYYGGDLDDLIQQHKLGVSVNGDDMEQIKEEIMNFYHLWQQNPSYEITPEHLEVFHYESLAKEVGKYIT